MPSPRQGIDAKKDDIELSIAMQWNDSYSESLLSFCNNINTHEGGTHVSVIVDLERRRVGRG